jgi:hypothetical protein
MSRSAELSACLHEIREYTKNHRELMEAHHFLFDLRHCALDDVRYVLMGQNPGELAKDHRIIARGEESSESDFRTTPKAVEVAIEEAARKGRTITTWTRPQFKWAQVATSMFGSNQFVQTERFFWSSSDLNEAFVTRFGEKFTKSKHLAFCASMNKRLIAIYKPVAVVCPGLSGWKQTVAAFGLKQIRAPTMSEKGKRLVEHYEDETSRPWFFTPNWTGSWGFTARDKAKMAAVIQEANHAIQG